MNSDFTSRRPAAREVLYDAPRIFVKTTGAPVSGGYPWQQQTQNGAGVFIRDPNGLSGPAGPAATTQGTLVMACSDVVVATGTLCEAVYYYAGYYVGWPLCPTSPACSGKPRTKYTCVNGLLVTWTSTDCGVTWIPSSQSCQVCSGTGTGTGTGNGCGNKVANFGVGITCNQSAQCVVLTGETDSWGHCSYVGTDNQGNSIVYVPGQYLDVLDANGNLLAEYILPVTCSGSGVTLTNYGGGCFSQGLCCGVVITDGSSCSTQYWCVTNALGGAHQCMADSDLFPQPISVGEVVGFPGGVGVVFSGPYATQALCQASGCGAPPPGCCSGNCGDPNVSASVTATITNKVGCCTAFPNSAVFYCSGGGGLHGYQTAIGAGIPGCGNDSGISEIVCHNPGDVPTLCVGNPCMGLIPFAGTQAQPGYTCNPLSAVFLVTDFVGNSCTVVVM